LVAGGVTVFGTSAPAAAHGQFVSSDPASGTEVTTALERILVYFTEKPTSNAYFAVTEPGGLRVDRLWSHGPSRPLDPPVHEWFHDENGDWVPRSYDTAYAAQIPIAYWPVTGEYKVTFLSVATDGQPVRGEFTFTYSGPTSTLPPNFRPQRSEPDPNLLVVAATDAPTAPASGPPIEERVAQEEAGPGLWILWVPIAMAAVAALAIYLFWRLRPQQARAIMVSRFGGRYAAAPPPRRPLQLPPGLAGRLPPQLRGKLPASVVSGAPGRGAGDGPPRARAALEQEDRPRDSSREQQDQPTERAVRDRPEPESGRSARDQSSGEQDSDAT
jgi:methionine-rich copper-binding protein CopC